MGLDMWLYKRGKTPKGKILIALEKEDEYDNIEVGYWRKCNLLDEKFRSCHIEILNADGGNCQDIPLTEEDLIEVKEWIEELTKKKVSVCEYDDNANQTSLSIINKILKETDFENYEIVYHAWW